MSGHVKIQINYVSGQSVVMEVEDFSVKKNNLGTEVTWKLNDESTMRPLLINVDAIESVWEVLK